MFQHLTLKESYHQFTQQGFDSNIPPPELDEPDIWTACPQGFKLRYLSWGLAPLIYVRTIRQNVYQHLVRENPTPNWRIPESTSENGGCFPQSARISQASTTIPTSTPPVTTLHDAAGPALKSHQRTSRHKSPEYSPPESPAYQTLKLAEYSQPELPACPPPKAEERLVISNTSETFSLWQRPPVHPLLKMFIFNYTNVDNFKDGIDDKLNVQEVGPYIYSETVEKVNIVFNDDSTLTFQENRTYQFLPEISAGSEDDLIKTPSIPLISADNELRKYHLNYFARFMVSATLRKIDPFRDLRVKDFLWGYDDPVYETAKTLAAFLNPLPYEKFGILVARNGLSEDRITMHSGVDDMSKLGIISRFNGIQELSHWGTAECNRIDGTDGTLYPVNQVSPNNTLHVFNHDLCRRFPLIFEKNVKSIAMFIANEDKCWKVTSVEATEFTELACDHEETVTRLSLQTAHVGESNISSIVVHADDTDVLIILIGFIQQIKCQAYVRIGAPIMLSFPHFFLGDPVLTDIVNGLQPDPRKHDMYVDMHEALTSLSHTCTLSRPMGLQRARAASDSTWLKLYRRFHEAGVGNRIDIVTA
uniref:Scavenger receptor class B member 1 n=1 Tax=Timema douglasi TaxID=61478 RepID=A0A7R8Z7B4_TIMDO|nr:unnamed protein product [Timema douglasi]